MMKSTLDKMGEAYQASYDNFKGEISSMYPALNRWELLTIANFVYDENLNKEDVLTSLKYSTWNIDKHTNYLKSVAGSLNEAENIRSDVALSKCNISTLIGRLKYRGIDNTHILTILTFDEDDDAFVNVKAYCQSIRDSAKAYLVMHSDEVD